MIFLIEGITGTRVTGSECEPGKEKQGVVATRIVAKTIVVFGAAVKLRVDGVLDA
jgi:hypothetical protein